MSVVTPGTDRKPAGPRNRAAEVTLLAVGAVVPRKGYDLLVAALSELTSLPWRLVIVGDGSRSPATRAQLEADIAARGLGARVALFVGFWVEVGGVEVRDYELYTGAQQLACCRDRARIRVDDLFSEAVLVA